jgi:hypothetical protein
MFDDKNNLFHSLFYEVVTRIVEAEKRAFTRAWAKRQRRLELLMTGTAGMYGDFQGIVGRSMPELQGLQAPQLDDGMGLDPPVGGTGLDPWDGPEKEPG